MRGVQPSVSKIRVEGKKNEVWKGTSLALDIMGLPLCLSLRKYPRNLHSKASFPR